MKKQWYKITCVDGREFIAIGLWMREEGFFLVIGSGSEEVFRVQVGSVLAVETVEATDGQSQ